MIAFAFETEGIRCCTGIFYAGKHFETASLAVVEVAHK